MNFSEYMVEEDVLSVFWTYLGNPIYSLYKGFKEGQKEADEEINKYLSELDKQIEEKEKQRRMNRIDDLNYETGLINLFKSKYELETMLQPKVIKPQKRRQPKITHSVNYKVYD